jgi:hypothetical protein
LALRALRNWYEEGKTMPELTIPAVVFEKLNEISERIGNLDAKVDGCITGIHEAKEYQRVQNGNLASAIQQVVALKQTLGIEEGERRGVSMTWQRIVIGLGIFLTFSNIGLGFLVYLEK